jgi:anti-sigma B factor antagonist
MSHEHAEMIQGMKTSTHWVGAQRDVVLLAVQGFIDTTTCKELAKQVRALMDQAHLHIIVDLGGVSYISSAGWGVFVGEIKNIRERGGDLKIVQMTSEVIEVFEMLEFNRILNHYETIEEAVDEFDIVRGIDITQVIPPKPGSDYQKTSHYPAPLHSVKKKTPRDAVISSAMTYEDLPLVEKVKQIVIDNPSRNTRAIQQQLRLEKYGLMRVNWFRVRKVLKELNLDTKDKRFRFYRSR